MGAGPSTLRLDRRCRAKPEPEIDQHDLRSVCRKEQAENGGELLAHYQAPLTHGQDVFMEFISGTYVSCNPPGAYTPFPCGNDNWFNQVWNEKRLHWENGQLVEKWSFASDWKPEPDAGGSLGGWQPVFHAALTNDSVWVPGAGGTVFRLAMGSETVLA